MDRGERPSPQPCSVCEGLDELVSRLRDQGISAFEIQEHLYIRAESLQQEVLYNRASRLKEARIARHVTQRALAEHIGITACHLSRVEHACERSSPDLVRRIAAALMVNEEWLLSGEKAKFDLRFMCSSLAKSKERKKSGKLGKNAVKILQHLSSRDRSRQELAEETGLSLHTVSSLLQRLSVNSLVKNVSWGVWRLTVAGRSKLTDA